MRRVLKVGDLNPDGVVITVAWNDMRVGHSIFVPCINSEKCKEQLKSIAKLKKWSFLIKIRVEDGKLGLRLWRTV